MQDFFEWRIRKSYQEIAVATNPEHIIQGAPTLDSIKEGIWGNSPVPPNIPKSETEPIANGENQQPEEREVNRPEEGDSTAPSSNSSGLVKRFSSPSYERFGKFVDDKLKRVDDLNKGLGDKGMGHLASSTFSNNPVQAGDTPTISKGIPVTDAVPF